MQVVILCGGERSTPLIEIAGRPIVWHVVSIYAAQGFHDFLLLTGDQSDGIARRDDWPEGVAIECVDTGVDTPSGGRVHAVRDRLDRRFCLTYADGVADIDLQALLARHRSARALATMTVVRPPLPFGVAVLDGARVTGFRESPVSEHWVNGGFFVLEPAALEYLDADSVLEREPLERLAAAGALAAYRHTGFWRSLDTATDAQALEEAGPSAWLA